MKPLFVIFLLFAFTGAGAQSLTLNDLVNLTTIDHQQAKDYLTNEKHFNALPVIDTVGTKISQFNKESLQDTSELVIKSEWMDGQRNEHQFVHYSVRPVMCADTIIRQLKSAGYRRISHEHDKLKTVSLYENEKFRVSIYTFSEKKLPAEIEVHVK